MTLSSGTRATTSSREIPAWSPAPPHASRTTRYSPSGRTSTRAAACSGPARTPAFGEAFGYEFNLETNAPCNPDDSGEDGCEPLQNDFLRYYLGAYLYNEAGTTPNGKLYDVQGVDTPFESLAWMFGGPSANNQDHSASFIATSGILPASEYPPFTSWASAKYDRPGGPFDPHTGSFYAYSNIADIS
jgi:hypothetical protein